MKKYVGILCGIVSAVSYGTNPLFGVPLLRVGYGVESMLFFRFLGAAVLLLPFAFYFGHGLRTTRSEAGVLFFVGVLFAVSSLALYESFKLMPAGIASAILFLYPVFTALIMGVFFKAPIGWRAATAIAVSFCGILLLADLRGGSVSALGIGLVVLSALSYSMYMVALKVTRLADMSALKVAFYSLLFSAVAFAIYFAARAGVPQIPKNLSEFLCVAGLIVFPTLLSITSIAFAVRYAGPTITAILGAFEPASAAVFCALFLGEKFTAAIVSGIGLVVLSVILLALPERKNLQNSRILRNS